MTRAVILDGRDIGAAQRATAGVLLRLLADADTDVETWAVLETLARRGVAVPRSELVGTIARQVPAQPSSVERTVDDAEVAGHVRVLTPVGGAPAGVSLELTTAGARRYRDLRSVIDHATDQLFAAIPRSELRAAQRVLAEVTLRAESWLLERTRAATPVAP